MKFIDSIYNKKDVITNIAKDILFRILGSLLSAFLFLNLLPTFMFIVYMKEKGIFSYDLFSNGVFGMSVFFFYGIMIILLLSIFMTSSLFFLIGLIIKKKCACNNSQKPKYCKYDYLEGKELTEEEKYRKRSELNNKDYIYLLIGSLLLNALFIFGLATVKQPIGNLFFLLSICSILTIHFANFIYLKAKFTIASLLFLFPFSILILFTYSPQTADIISFGLHSFNSSNKIVDVKDMNNNILLSGKMLLLSPENIYVYTQENNETNSTQIIKRDNIIINIKN
ncbi:hypothetical protein [Sulfurimonas sp. RIFOXYB12_FULL_35_9]|jgi:hypothetical protein|uniref:hypothetical protein n=1 Tax=Sulfurimonas sp. RIFOXYB12_FULL_35_9 TaxID=1802256 RepID=UPI0008B448A0|nr:hypothetical protein [Sulfurimonas sp. RIFOXYB12_FULL_35_9]OHE03154.1 MAG: hypothetical protein A2345_05820 [Sulfurimonas sp. RIFOXYB12_FULL_35_9]